MDEEDSQVTPVAVPPQYQSPPGSEYPYIRPEEHITEPNIPPGYDPGPFPTTPGQGYTYSTQGKQDWTTKQERQLPGGQRINIPGNAQNFASVVGPPPEDAYMAGLRKQFANLPMEQAIKSYQAARQFLAGRLVEQDLAESNKQGIDPKTAIPKALMRGAAAGLFSTPKELLDWNKNTSSDAAERAKQQFEARKMAMDAAAARQAASQQFQLQKMQLGQGGSNTRLQLEQYQKQRDILQRDVDKAEEGVGSLVMDDEGQARLKAKKDKIDAIDNQMDTIRKQLGLTVPETEPPPKKTPFKEGARIRNKKDGKMYVVRNGVPVPEGQ